MFARSKTGIPAGQDVVGNQINNSGFQEFDDLFQRSKAREEKIRGDKRSGMEWPVDSFAIKLSIPPLVLLGYVSFRFFRDPDVRLKRVQEAEARFSAFEADRKEELNTSRALQSLGEQSQNRQSHDLVSK